MTSKHTPLKHNKTNPITEGMSELLEELKLSTRWDRPSILMVVCQSRLTMLQAQISLKNKIRRYGQQVKVIQVNPDNYDIALHLSLRSDSAKTVFFISDLHNGGGVAGLNAFRALNMRRELLVDHSIRVVFWLSEEESTTMMMNAIDFWAFRHRLVELLNSPEQNLLPGLLHKLSELPWEAQNQANLAPVDVGQLTALLSELKAFRSATRLSTWLQISHAAVQWAGGKFSEAQALLQKVLADLQVSGDQYLQAECLASLGQVYFSAGDLTSAIEVIEKSLKIKPKNITAWLILAKVHMIQQHADEMMLTLKSLLALYPSNTEAWVMLGDLQVSKNQLEEAAISFLKAQAGTSKNALTWKKLGDIYALKSRWDLAGMYYRKYCRLEKTGPVFLKLGGIYELLGQSQRAIRAYKQSTCFDELNPEPWRALAKLYKAEKHPRAEKKALSMAAAIAKKLDTH